MEDQTSVEDQFLTNKLDSNFKQTIQISRKTDTHDLQDYFHIIFPMSEQMIKTKQKYIKLKCSNEKLKDAKIFNSFKNRGKNSYIKYSYDNLSNLIQIKINERYFVQYLRLSENYLIKVYFGFLQLWKAKFTSQIDDFLIKIIRYKQEKIHQSRKLPIKVELQQIDLISFTFKMILQDSSEIKIKASYFQFRNNLRYIIKEQQQQQHQQQTQVIFQSIKQIVKQYIPLQLTQQYISFTLTKSCVLPNSFYHKFKLNFLKGINLTISNLKKIQQRFQFFYDLQILMQYILLSKLPYTQFYKRAYQKFNYSSTQLQKFQFTFIFEKPLLLNTNQSQKYLSNNNESIVFDFIFRFKENQQSYQYPPIVQMFFIDPSNFFTSTKINKKSLKTYWFQLLQKLFKLSKKNKYKRMKQSDEKKQFKKIIKGMNIIKDPIQHPRCLEVDEQFIVFISTFCTKIAIVFERLYFFSQLNEKLLTQEKVDIKLINPIKQRYYQIGSKFRYDFRYKVVLQNSIFFENNLNGEKKFNQNKLKEVIIIIEKVFEKQQNIIKNKWFRKGIKNKNIIENIIDNSEILYQNQIGVLLLKGNIQNKQQKKRVYIRNQILNKIKEQCNILRQQYTKMINQRLIKQNQGKKITKAVENDQYKNKVLIQLKQKDIINIQKQIESEKKIKTTHQSKVQLNQQIIKYINMIINEFPLQIIYTYTYELIINVTKIIYNYCSSKTQNNLVKNQFKQKIISIIFKLILQAQYKLNKLIYQKLNKQHSSNQSQKKNYKKSLNIIIQIHIEPCIKQKHSNLTQKKYYLSSIENTQIQNQSFAELTFSIRHFQNGWKTVIPNGNLFINLYKNKFQIENGSFYQKKTFQFNESLQNQKQFIPIYDRILQFLNKY